MFLPPNSGAQALLNDSRFEGFFLRFRRKEAKKPFHVPQCDGAKCTAFYHDQTQSPQSGAQCSSCKNCGCCADGACDVGKQPCGEYLWNHANGSMLRDWLVNEYVGGASGLGSPDIDGVFLPTGCPTDAGERRPALAGCSATRLGTQLAALVQGRVGF